MNPVTVSGGSFDPTMIVVGLFIIAAVVGIVWWHRKNPTQSNAVLADAHAGATELANKLADLLHKKEDTSAKLAEVVVSAPVQRAINEQPAPAIVPTPLNVIIGAPVMPAGPTLYQGLPRDPHYVYPDQPEYKKSGNMPPWGWVPVLREQMGLDRYIDPTEFAKPGEGPGPHADENQMRLIRTSYDSALPNSVRSAALVELAATLGFPNATLDSDTPANRAVAAMLQANPWNG